MAVVRMCTPTDGELLEALLMPGVLRSLSMAVDVAWAGHLDAEVLGDSSETQQLVLLIADCATVMAKVLAATQEAPDAQLQDVLDEDVVEALQRGLFLPGTPLHKLDCSHLKVRVLSHPAGGGLLLNSSPHPVA